MRGRRLIFFTVVVAVIALAGELYWYRNVRIVAGHRREARAMEIGLNEQFMANPRFRNLRVLGYSGKAHLFSTEETFSVAGWVTSKKDFSDAWRVINALHPPGRFQYSVSVRVPRKPPVTVRTNGVRQKARGH